MVSVAVGEAAMARAASSFDDAFPDLIPRAFQLAYRMLGDRGLAEDVAADAMSITLLRWHRVCDLSYREAWVLRVTANLALKAAKRGRRERSQPVAAAREAGGGFEHD